MNVIETQLEQLKEKFPTSVFIPNVNPKSSILGTIHISDFKLPVGWNTNTTDVYFEIPAGYPCACPQHFHTSPNLLLKENRLPRNTQLIDINDKSQLVFFWRITRQIHTFEQRTNWSPNSDTLLTYVRVIQSRFNNAI